MQLSYAFCAGCKQKLINNENSARSAEISPLSCHVKDEAFLLNEKHCAARWDI
jgi:hypothetical protein